MRPIPPGKLSDREFDPAVPAAYPVTGVADLMGNMPVRVRAEGAALVAYGFGGQRVEVPRAQIGSVLVHYVRNSKGDVSNPSLAVLDHQGRLLPARPGPAPTGNLAGGALAILTVPPLAWLSVRRITASRRKLRDEAIEGISLSLSYLCRTDKGCRIAHDIPIPEVG